MGNVMLAEIVVSRLLRKQIKKERQLKKKDEKIQKSKV